eukprot:Nitzschia sp. Nitz4//scaffold111_size72815//16494//17243//NITZ4_005782-RA/size72815-exonerate_est2genome-gene-0.88-mRNA-1//-1//CDS//3329533156//7699//frame0
MTAQISKMTRALWWSLLLALSSVKGEGQIGGFEALQTTFLQDVVGSEWEGIEMMVEAPAHLGDFAGLLIDETGALEWTLGERSSTCSDAVMMKVPCSSKRRTQERDGTSDGIKEPNLLQTSSRQAASLSSKMKASSRGDSSKRPARKQVQRRTRQTSAVGTNSSDVCGMWIESCDSGIWCNSFRVKISTEADSLRSGASRMYVLSKPIHADDESPLAQCPVPPRDVQFQSAHLKHLLAKDVKAFHFRRA